MDDIHFANIHFANAPFAYYYAAKISDRISSSDPIDISMKKLNKIEFHLKITPLDIHINIRKTFHLFRKLESHYLSRQKNIRIDFRTV